VPGVELGHEFAIGGAGGGEFFGAFLELAAQLEELLFAVGECGLQAVKIVGCAESAVGATPGRQYLIRRDLPLGVRENSCCVHLVHRDKL
jgi:hypothetical protein